MILKVLSFQPICPMDSMNVAPNVHDCFPFSESVNVAPNGQFDLCALLISGSLSQLIQFRQFQSNLFNRNIQYVPRSKRHDVRSIRSVLSISSYQFHPIDFILSILSYQFYPIDFILSISLSIRELFQ